MFNAKLIIENFSEIQIENFDLKLQQTFISQISERKICASVDLVKQIFHQNIIFNIVTNPKISQTHQVNEKITHSKKLTL